MNNQRRIVFGILIITGVLFLIGAALIALSSPRQAQSPTATQVILLGDIPRVSVTDAKAALDQKAAVFVDVRDAQSFASGHVPGALSIPLAELPNRLSELKKNEWIITVCT